MKKYFLLFLILGIVLVNCKKNDDSPDANPIVSEEPDEETTVEPKLVADYPVQNFMWTAMNAYYFYQADVADLADTRFTTEEGYADFLSSTVNPSDFYFNKLLASADRFSFLNEDYAELANDFAGISKSNGLEFGLSLYGANNDVFGFVRYVVKGSNASSKDIKRGDIFTTVDGQGLFYNSETDNNLDLLFGDNDTYTLGMADIINLTIVPNNKTVTLTKEEGLIEDPILVQETLDIGGQKVGYLMFNQFAGGSGEPLNDAFGRFKTNGVTDLILDLRYNPGGFAHITQILGSLIYGPNPDDLFFKRRFNAKIQATFGPGDGETYFVSDTGTFDGSNETPLNSLNLTKIYIIATGNSASASELLINGLRPYLDVVHIGSTTVGKNQGSITFVDDPSNGYFYDPETVNQINPNNRWAIQPIVSQTENSAGFGDYSAGLVPNIQIDEDITELGVLGDMNERLLARAIQELTGISSKMDFTAKIPVDLVTSSSLRGPMGGKLLFIDVPASFKIPYKRENR
ncbi:MAG: S41 family peptidase [Flavobacteriaceae bacterium]